MEQLIQSFSALKFISNIEERSLKRNELFKDLTNVVNKSENITIDSIITHTDNWGEVVAFLICIHAKLNQCECYTGSILTMNRLRCICALTHHQSTYIRQLARLLLTIIVTKKIMLSDERDEVLSHVLSYRMDAKEGYDWVWDCLVKMAVKAEDAWLGSMVGQCVGDALGFIVEGHDASVCRHFVTEFVMMEQVPSWVRIQGMTFGQYSDDSQLARETYVAWRQAGGKIDPVVYGLRIACMFQPGHYRIVGYGATTAKAGEALFHGEHHSTTGSTTTHGNGSAMRSAPLGLLLAAHSDTDLIDAVTTYSSITHASPDCINGSLAIAFAAKASMATRHIRFDVKTFLDYVAKNVSDERYKNEIENIAILLTKGDDEAKTHIANYGVFKGEERWGDGISSGVMQSTLWALYSFCKYPDQYKECMATAIICGGDVDTTAAMAGALIGARIGIDQIPAVWKNTIHDLEDWKFDDVCKLVRDVYSKCI